MSQRPDLPRFGPKGVLVIGDVMLDRYWCGAVSRISPEAPVPVVNVDEIEDRPGGAGNVALNLAALGCPVWLLGATGKDEAAELLQKQLEGAGVHCNFIEYPEYPTITKLRILSQRQQLLRLDFEQSFTPNTHIIESHADTLLDNIEVCLLSDYAKGMLKDPQPLIRQITAKNIPVIIDPKGNDFSRYRGATLLTPNLSEFQAVVGPCSDEKSFVEKGQLLCEQLQLDALLVTRSEQGMTLICKNEEEIHFPAQAKEVYDVTGAGDTVIATLAAALTAGQKLPQAVCLANIAAGMVVGKVGTAAISLPELGMAINNHGEKYSSGGIVSLEQLVIAVEEAREQGETIIFASGCFDILHPEHVEVLKKASTKGSRLVVAVHDDASVASLRGVEPVNHVERRMNILAGFKWIDWVVMLCENTFGKIITEIQPDIVLEEQRNCQRQTEIRKIVEGYGGKIVTIQAASPESAVI